MLLKSLPAYPFLTREKQLHKALSDLENEKEIKEELFNKKLLLKLLKLKKSEKFIKIIGGYSNETYQIDDLVLRFPKLNNPLVRNLSVEIYNLQIAYDLKLSPLLVIAYYCKHNLLVTQFIRQYRFLTPEDLDVKKIKSIAELVKKLHYCGKIFKKNPETPLAFVNSTSKTFAKIKIILNNTDNIILNKINLIKNILASFNATELPSHGDLHHGNIIELHNQLQLVDWEVASMEDPAYDIARLFYVSDINEENRRIFLCHYKQVGENVLSEKDIECLMQRIRLYIPINFISIVFWARFAIQFSEDSHQRKLLEETISTFNEKALQTLNSINLNQFQNENFLATHQSLLFKSRPYRHLN